MHLCPVEQRAQHLLDQGSRTLLAVPWQQPLGGEAQPSGHCFQREDPGKNVAWPCLGTKDQALKEQWDASTLPGCPVNGQLQTPACMQRRQGGARAQVDSFAEFGDVGLHLPWLVISICRI